jgi:ribose transport system ATP-binding protein
MRRASRVIVIARRHVEGSSSMSQSGSQSREVAPVLSVRDVSKTYGATRALREVSLDIRPGEMHALAGGNGSGKSTLVKILAGVVASDSGGTLRVGDTTIESDKITPSLARSVGLHFVHQDVALFPELSVADNLFLGHGFDAVAGVHISRRNQVRRAAEIIERFDLGVSPTALVAGLSAGKRATIAIARALQDQGDKHSGILVLDEPTASLPAREVEDLLSTLRRFANAGQAVVYITHRLDEMCGVADRVSVLRDGNHIGTYDGASMTERDLITHIVGRPVNDVFPSMERSDRTDVALEVRGLASGQLEDVTFNVCRGEVVGIAGLLGSGRSTLLRTIFGELPKRAGTISLNGMPLDNKTPKHAMRSGIGLVPEDRANEAAFPEMSIQENITAASLSDFWRGGKIRTGREHREAQSLIKKFGIKAHSAGQPLSALSGGNQQKAIFARWLRRQPAVLLLDEPTQGVDVGARAEIYQLVRDSVGAGTSVLIVASDFEELGQVCDRVLIVRGGRIVDEIQGPGIDPDQLTDLTYGRQLEPQ